MSILVSQIEMSVSLFDRSCVTLRRVFIPRIKTVTRIYATNNSSGLKRTGVFLRVLTVLVGSGCGYVYFIDRSRVKALVDELHAPNYPWDFKGIIKSLDHASLRRGWEVYKTICSQCHSLKYVAFRELVGVTHNEEEAKALADSVEIADGPDEKGEMFKRPGKLSDYIPSPYPNEESARLANDGAYPPDLTYMINARHNGENYLFSLLTSWMDPPAGVNLQDGQSFNPYFPGGAIGMGQVIDDGALEFGDGTPATQSQIAKDVVSFLTWTANPEFDKRKIWFIKSLGISIILIGTVYRLYKHKMASVKARQIFYTPRKKSSSSSSC